MNNARKEEAVQKASINSNWDPQCWEPLLEVKCGMAIIYTVAAENKKTKYGDDDW